jgi:hypothetical protein
VTWDGQWSSPGTQYYMIVPEEDHWPSQVTDKLYHIILCTWRRPLTISSHWQTLSYNIVYLKKTTDHGQWSSPGTQYYMIKFVSDLRWSVVFSRYTILYDKVCLTCDGRWFSPGPPVSSTNNTYCHNITEILLKMVLTMYMYLLNCFLYLNFLFITGGSNNSISKSNKN